LLYLLQFYFSLVAFDQTHVLELLWLNLMRESQWLFLSLLFGRRRNKTLTHMMG
jgi:hypothetical protein